MRFFIAFTVLMMFLLTQPDYALSVSFPKDDSVITAQLEAKIAKDHVLAPLHLEISTRNQVVSIAGIVPLPIDAERLIMWAESIAGVQAVDVANLYLLSGSVLSSDGVITGLVAGLLLREGLPAGIIVQTINGTVFLSGVVDDAAKADDAVKLAQSIPGVHDVQSSITVKSPS